MDRNPARTDDRQIRVMHVITPSRMAGAETALARLLRHAAGGKVVLSCTTSLTPALDDMLAAGMELQSLGIGGKANLLAVPRLRQVARNFDADLLHSHLSTASWWCGWLEQFGGPPSIGHVHGFTSVLWHRMQSHLVACSAAVKADLVAKGIPAERISVLYCGVDPADQQPTRSPAATRAELGADTDTPIVGTFAHLSIKKGYRELILAAEIVLRRMPRAQFWCFGDGPLRQELEQQAQTMGIADRFKLFGFRRDVPDLMRAVNVMCLPSHREPFGLVYVEAALAGKPVIGCDAGGVPEIISSGENGFLVPPMNPPALAESILSLLTDRGQAARMGQQAAEMAKARFQWPKFVGQLHELYERVLAERGAGQKAA